VTCRTVIAVSLLVALPACSDETSNSIYEKIAFDQLVNACIVSSACSVKRYPRISDCVDSYFNLALRFGLGPVYDQIFGCLADAKGDCDAAFECYGSHRAAGTCDTTYQAKCSSNKALTCDTLAGPNGNGRVFTFDCSHAGLSCRTRQGGSFEADCTVGACNTGDPRRCDGNRLLSCKTDGNLELDDCATRGLVCGKTATGGLECIGEMDEACDSSYQAHCMAGADVAAICVNGKVHREDCTRRPFNKRCEAAACVRSGTACADEFNRCQGDKMQYCLDGSWHTVDCVGIGLGACAPSVNGADCSAKY